MSSDFDLPQVPGSELVSQSFIEECKAVFESDGVRGFQKLLKNKLEAWKDIPLNVAVIGNSGVGKSSFINSIRYVLYLKFNMFINMTDVHIT